MARPAANRNVRVSTACVESIAACRARRQSGEVESAERERFRLSAVLASKVTRRFSGGTKSVGVNSVEI